jgi:hypothetical protein
MTTIVMVQSGNVPPRMNLCRQSGDQGMSRFTEHVMILYSRLLATIGLVAAPTLMFLAASVLFMSMTSPGRAESFDAVPHEVGPVQPRQIAIRGGETIDVPGANGRVLTLRFTRVINDGRCATPACKRTAPPVVEIQQLGVNGRAAVFRMSPAAHLAAPFVPVQGRFVAFGELVSPPRELTTGNRPAPLEDYVLKLTVSP